MSSRANRSQSHRAIMRFRLAFQLVFKNFRPSGPRRFPATPRDSSRVRPSGICFRPCSGWDAWSLHRSWRHGSAEGFEGPSRHEPPFFPQTHPARLYPSLVEGPGGGTSRDPTGPSAAIGSSRPGYRNPCSGSLVDTLSAAWGNHRTLARCNRGCGGFPTEPRISSETCLVGDSRILGHDCSACPVPDSGSTALDCAGAASFNHRPRSENGRAANPSRGNGGDIDHDAGSVNALDSTLEGAPFAASPGRSRHDVGHDAPLRVPAARNREPDVRVEAEPNGRGPERLRATKNDHPHRRSAAQQER